MHESGAHVYIQALLAAPAGHLLASATEAYIPRDIFALSLVRNVNRLSPICSAIRQMEETADSTLFSKASKCLEMDISTSCHYGGGRHASECDKYR